MYLLLFFTKCFSEIGTQSLIRVRYGDKLGITAVEPDLQLN